MCVCVCVCVCVGVWVCVCVSEIRCGEDLKRHGIERQACAAMMMMVFSLMLMMVSPVISVTDSIPFTHTVCLLSSM